MRPFKCNGFLQKLLIVNLRRHFSDCGDTLNRKGVVVGVYQDEENQLRLTEAARKLNESSNGKLLELMKSSGAEYHAGKTTVFNNFDQHFYAVGVVGLGPMQQGYNELEAIHEGMEMARRATAKGIRKLMTHEECHEIHVDDMGYAECAAEGAILSLYRFQEYKAQEYRSVIPVVHLFGSSDVESFKRGVFKAEAQNLVRKWVDTPSNLMTPLHFAQEVFDLLCPCGVRVDIHQHEWILANHMEALMHVSKGSCEPSLFVEVSYCGGGKDQRPIILAGKGTTFDSGGLCLRRPDELPERRGDISGAAAIVAAMYAVSALSLPINVTACFPVCENMLSGMAMKCGDILYTPRKQSVMIADTCNEGILLVGEAMQLAQIRLNPRLIIDVGNFSKGSRYAFGSGATPVYTNSQTMWSQVRKAGILSGDRVWRMPLWKFFTDRITRFPSHDLDNKGTGKASSPLAAAFLQEYLHCIDWIHFDTTGTSMLSKDKCFPYYEKGAMTGRPTRTLIQLIYQLACPEEGSREIN